MFCVDRIFIAENEVFANKVAELAFISAVLTGNAVQWEEEFI